MEKITKFDTTIDTYILQFPIETQLILNELRDKIKSWVPDASEKMSYGIPTFYLNGNLVHFAAYKNHIGFYPGASGIENFSEVLKNYKTSKGAVQFPIDQPLPFNLMEKITLFRVQQNLSKKKK